jgi:hypothetical protein
MFKKILLLIVIVFTIMSCWVKWKKEIIDNEEKISINNIEKKWLWDVWSESNTIVENGFKN